MRHQYTPAVLVLLLLTLGACAYSPWEAETSCDDPLEENLAQLQGLLAQQPDPQQFTVAHVTDSEDTLMDLELVVRRINDHPEVLFTLVTGDLTTAGRVDEFEWTCNALTELNVPRFYTIGNHDAISFGKQIFRDNFAPFDYAFSVGSTRFVVYNDNAFEFPDAPDLSFIAAAAAVQPGETRAHTIGVSHSPPTTGPHTGEEALALRQFLGAQGFDYTVHGHRHQLDLFIDEFGVTHFVGNSVEGGHYALMTVDRDGAIQFRTCRTNCIPIEPES